MGDGFTVELIDVGADDATMRLSGQIEDRAGPEIMEIATSFVARNPHRRLVVDMSEVHFIDSSGLSILIRLERATGAGMLVVQRPSDVVERILDVTGLRHHLQVVHPPEAPSASGPQDPLGRQPGGDAG